MRFVCAACQRAMEFVSSDGPHSGSMSVTFGCPKCDYGIALLTNPAETQLLISLGIKIGGRAIRPQAMELVRESLTDPRPTQSDESQAEPVWTQAAEDRLSRAPSFVRGLARRRYNEFARTRGIREISPEVMDEARRELGMEGL